LHLAQCDIWRQLHSHVWVPCAVVYVHRQCSPCVRQASHMGTRAGMAVGVSIKAPTCGDVRRRIAVSRTPYTRIVLRA